MPARAAAAARRRAEQPPRPRPLARRPGEPADRPRRGQPLLADATSAPAWSRRPRTSARRANGPSHPELLDWLATEFVRERLGRQGDCSRLIVTSATYRQSSRVTPELLRTRPGEPPAGPRAAVPAVGRDDPRPGAGASAACWSSSSAGPSVKPYQPAGLWKELTGGDGLRAGPRARTCTAAACTRSGSGPSPPPAHD